eukprot:GFUD01049824.1.p1 GENE.GFUD01049824.1~~GFUD01049824.1.p1  ORF type:complete len:190 (+),score=53.48 GFUD01049824.1:58-570(+)
MKMFAIVCLLGFSLASPIPQNEEVAGATNWLGLITGIISQVRGNEGIQEGIVTAQKGVSTIGENIPENLTSTLRDNLLSIIQQQNLTQNIPAIRTFLVDNVANLTLPEGLNFQTVVAALPSEEATTNLRSSVADNLPSTDTINMGIQTVLDNIPDDAIGAAGNLLTNLFG